MDEAKKAEAKRFAARATEQAKHAARNSARAAEEGVESVTDPVTEKIEEGAETVFNDVNNMSDLTKGVSAVLAAGALVYFAVKKFRGN